MRQWMRWAAIAVLIAAGGCGARGAETRDPNMIVCAWIAGPDSFDPLTAVGSSSRMVNDLIHTQLVSIGANLLPNWRASFAQKVEILDAGKRYVLHLRRNGRWTDGKPVTSKDVVFTLAVGNNPAITESNASDFTLMQSVRALDPYTVEIRLSRPSPPFLENALGETYVLPAHVLQKFAPGSAAEAQFINTNTDYAQNPVSSGAFLIARNVSDSYLVLKPNPQYWGEVPHLPAIAFRVYPQQDSLFAAVDAGEVDVTDIPPNLWSVHRRLRGAHRFVNWPWNVAFYLLPNFRDPNDPYIKDRAVRQAMMYAMNRPFITKGIMNGQADILNGPTPTFSPYYDPRVHTYAYDPAKARSILEADGWKLQGSTRVKNGVALRFTIKTGGATDAVASNVAQLIQANMRAVGIDCIIENEEIGTFFSDLHNTRFQISLRGVILSAYPDDYKNFDSHQTRKLGGYNIGSYGDPQADRLMEAARTASTPQAARANLNAWQEYASRELPALFLYSNRLAAVVPPDLTGYSLTPLAPAALPMGLESWRLHPKPARASL